MATITISGIRIKELTIAEDTDSNETVIRSSYQLATTAGRTIGAKETLSSKSAYGDKTFTPSPQTIAALRTAAELYRKDVELMLGLSDAVPSSGA